MGTKVEIDSYMTGHCSMRDLSRELNGASWPQYVDNSLPNGQFYHGFLPRTTSNLHPGYDKDVMKQTMLEHETIFKNPVFEPHRLNQVQRDRMDEVRRRDQMKCPISYEGSSSSSRVPSQMQHENAQRWKGPTPPLAANFVVNRPIPSAGIVQSSPYYMKGKSIQASPSPFQNCRSPKDSKVPESRPTKVRRKMLDLQLPADEYIDLDEVEQHGDVKVVNNMTPSRDKNEKSFLNYPVKMEYHEDTSRFDSNVTKFRAPVDLNEPLHAEEATTVSSVGLLGATPSLSNVQYRGPTKFLGSSKDVPQSSMLESVRSINNGTPWTSPQPMRGVFNQLSQPLAFLTCDQIKGDPWKEQPVRNLEKYNRSFSVPRYDMPEPILSSHAPNQASRFYPSNVGNAWDQCGSSWSKPHAFPSSPFMNSNALSKSHQLSTQSNDLFGNKWNLNSVPTESSMQKRFNQGSNLNSIPSESSMRNGFNQGSSSSIKELPGRFPPSSSDYRDMSVPCSTINYLKARTCLNGSPMKDMNLNIPPVQTLEPDCKIVGNNQKSTEPLTALPWLRGNNHTVKAEKSESSDFLNSRKILGVPIYDKLVTPKKENPTLISNSDIDHQTGKVEFESSWRKGGFDMNLPCEISDSELDTMNVEDTPTEKRAKNESANVRNHFDLNLCANEEESPCQTTLRRDTGIDLEAPAMIESEEDVLEVHVKKEQEERKPEIPADRADDEEAELAKLAAEMIVAISSSATPNQSFIEASDKEMLQWFAGVACSSGNSPESHMIPDHRDNNQVLDEYESMVLRQKECNVEEYFPKPCIPKYLNIEQNGKSILTTRTRRLHARRGRQRRDFQRDILPGLTSLSKHEVTEDLQTCGGLMSGTTHPWNSAPVQRNGTRNGCGRGRRRSTVVEYAPVDTGLSPSKQIPSGNTEGIMEDGCISGWGKTTRRPRRQRCLSGNPPSSYPSS